MTPAKYDAWYDTPRGRWIGETEFNLLHRLLAAEPGETLLGVGCGTGWFTRRFAIRNGWNVTGLDTDADCLAFASAWPQRALSGRRRPRPSLRTLSTRQSALGRLPRRGGG